MKSRKLEAPVRLPAYLQCQPCTKFPSAGNSPPGVLIRPQADREVFVEYIDGMVLRLVNDFIFLYVFGREETKDLLLDLVNAVLEDAGGEPVQSLELKNPTRQRDAYWRHGAALDIRATAADGTQFDIEMQVANHPAFISRSLYYWSDLYSAQLHRGKAYSGLRPVVCINLLDFVLFPDKKKNHHRFIITEAEDPETILTEDLEIHFVELTKASPHANRLSDWVTVLENAGEEWFDMSHVVFKRGEVFPQAYRLYEHCTEDERLRIQAQSRARFQRDQISDLEGAIEKGRAEGEAKGKADGKAEGKAEGKADIVRRMLARGMSVDTIADITGLPEHEILAMTGGTTPS